MLKLDDLVVDKEFDGLLPVLTLEEFERLEQSILKNGMLQTRINTKSPRM